MLKCHPSFWFPACYRAHSNHMPPSEKTWVPWSFCCRFLFHELDMSNISTSSWSSSSVNLTVFSTPIHSQSLCHYALRLQFGLLAFQSWSDIQLGLIQTSGLLQIRRRKKTTNHWCNMGFSENGVYHQSWYCENAVKWWPTTGVTLIPVLSHIFPHGTLLPKELNNGFRGSISDKATNRTSTLVLGQSAFLDQPGNLHAQWDRPWLIVPGRNFAMVGDGVTLRSVENIDHQWQVKINIVMVKLGKNG